MIDAELSAAPLFLPVRVELGRSQYGDGLAAVGERDGTCT